MFLLLAGCQVGMAILGDAPQAPRFDESYLVQIDDRFKTFEG
jgi:hypothetical protein